MSIEELKKNPSITREDIVNLLLSIGKPGKNQDEKLQAVQELERTNSQGFGIHETLESYPEY
jgi:hypothetical protein